MEAGYLSVEIEQLELGLKSKPDKDPSVRLDLAITNAYSIFQWASTGDETFSTSVFHPMYRPNEDVENSESPAFSYVNGFSNQFVRSTFIDLNDEVMNGLANSFLEINVVSINDKPADAAPAKPAKGAPPVEVKPAEDSLIKLTLPLHALLTAKNCILNLYEALSVISQKPPFNSANAAVLHESIVDHRTSLCLKISSDNDFAEYALGCKVFQWSSALFTSPPASWGLHAPDITDPKAKVPPTAVDLRSKYLENINRLIKDQSNICSYELSIGISKDNNTEKEVEEPSGEVSAESSVTARIQSYFPANVLTGGKVSFNTEAAEGIPTDEDIRTRKDLWTISWESSAVIFMNRKVARKFLFLLFQEPAAACLPVVLKKLPTSSYAEVEGGDLQLTGRVNIQQLTSTGILQCDFPVLFDEHSTDTTTTGSGDTLSKLNTVLTVNAPLLPISALDKLPPSTEHNSPTGTSIPIPKQILSNRKVTNTDTNTDILQQLRAHITQTIEKIATEYVSLYPESTQSLPSLTATTTNIHITTTSDSNTQINENNTTTNDNNHIQTKEERKIDFLNYLMNNGIFHELKESLRPSIQQLIREKYGNRGRALGKSSILSLYDQNTATSTNGNNNKNDHQKEITQDNINILLSELYIYLNKECSLVLNSLFTDTVIHKNIQELEKYSYIDDQTETEQQCIARLLLQATDLTANGQYNEANAVYLERLTIINHSAELSNNSHILYTAYQLYGEFLLQQAASVLISTTTNSNSTSAMHELLLDKTQTLLNRAREALYAAHSINPSAWRTGLLYAGVLIELDQTEQAELTLRQALEVQLTAAETGGGKSFDLQSFDDFDGYDSDALCPVDPMCYSALAALFYMQGHTLKARKALLLANRSFAEGAFKPDISTHGTPRRTIVLTLSETGLYFFKHSLIRLAQSCTQLAIDSEAAVTAKATARGKPASTVPHIKYLLKRLQSISSLYGQCTRETVTDATQKLEVAVQCGKDAQLVADNPLDEVQAWGTLAIALQLSGSDSAAVVDAFLNAVGCSRKLSVEEVKDDQVVPLGLFVQTAKLLLQGGRYHQARTILLYGCTIYTSATLFMLLGVCYLRLDDLEEAEVALVEANLLDNRNTAVWAYLSLVCLASGPHRMVEAEKSLEQTLRLGQEDAQILRELATSFMSVDKLQTAEDLIRRALRKESLEAGGSGASNRYTSNARTRRLLADILAGQNQAVRAVDEYQLVIADENADIKTKLEACERCSVLLSSLGREEELLTLKNIVTTLTSTEHENNSNNNNNTTVQFME